MMQDRWVMPKAWQCDSDRTSRLSCPILLHGTVPNRRVLHWLACPRMRSSVRLVMGVGAHRHLGDLLKLSDVVLSGSQHIFSMPGFRRGSASDAGARAWGPMRGPHAAACRKTGPGPGLWASHLRALGALDGAPGAGRHHAHIRTRLQPCAAIAVQA